MTEYRAPAVDFETMTAALMAIVAFANTGGTDAFLISILRTKPADLHTAAEESAAEEFETLPGVPPGVPATGRLENIGLDDEQKAVVKEAMVDMFEIAYMLGGLIAAKRVTEEKEAEANGSD